MYRKMTLLNSLTKEINPIPYSSIFNYEHMATTAEAHEGGNDNECGSIFLALQNAQHRGKMDTILRNWMQNLQNDDKMNLSKRREVYRTLLLKICEFLHSSEQNGVQPTTEKRNQVMNEFVHNLQELEIIRRQALQALQAETNERKKPKKREALEVALCNEIDLIIPALAYADADLARQLCFVIQLTIEVELSKGVERYPAITEGWHGVDDFHRRLLLLAHEHVRPQAPVIAPPVKRLLALTREAVAAQSSK